MKKKRTYTPEKQTLRLTEKLLPELNDLSVGETTEIRLKVKLISLSEGDEYGLADSGWGEEEYGKEYVEARKKDQSQLRGRFEVIEADEESEPQESAEAKKAREITSKIKRGRMI